MISSAAGLLPHLRAYAPAPRRGRGPRGTRGTRCAGAATDGQRHMLGKICRDREKTWEKWSTLYDVM